MSSSNPALKTLKRKAGVYASNESDLSNSVAENESASTINLQENNLSVMDDDTGLITSPDHTVANILLEKSEANE